MKSPKPFDVSNNTQFNLQSKNNKPCDDVGEACRSANL